MAMEYFCWFNAYRKKTENLTDQEVGRLIRALSYYNETGERLELKGREAIAFDFIAADIDAATDRYNAKCATNRQNRASTTVNDRQRPSTTVDKTKNKNQKPKEPNGSITPLPPTEPAFNDPELQAAFEAWLAYKRERREPYKETGEKALVSRLKKDCETKGVRAVIDAINWSMSNNWQGIHYPDKQTKDTQNTGSGYTKQSAYSTAPSYDISRAEQKAKTSVPTLTKKERR